MIRPGSVSALVVRPVDGQAREHSNTYVLYVQDVAFRSSGLPSRLFCRRRPLQPESEMVSSQHQLRSTASHEAKTESAQSRTCQSAVRLAWDDGSARYFVRSYSTYRALPGPPALQATDEAGSCDGRLARTSRVHTYSMYVTYCTMKLPCSVRRVRTFSSELGLGQTRPEKPKSVRTVPFCAGPASRDLFPRQRLARWEQNDAASSCRPRPDSSRLGRPSFEANAMRVLAQGPTSCHELGTDPNTASLKIKIKRIE